MEIAIENGRIPCTFSNQGNLRFIPAFTPREPGKHEVTIKFNSYEVPGSPFICNVIDLNKLTLINCENPNGPLLFSIYKTHTLEINSQHLSSNDINIKLMSPSHIQLPLSRTVTPYNTIKFNFQATEIGTHVLEIDYAGAAISGSPFDLKIFDSSRINVSEVIGGEVNRPCELTIDASNAGEGQLEIAINDGNLFLNKYNYL